MSIRLSIFRLCLSVLLLILLLTPIVCAEPLRLAVLGDSLTAGYGLAATDAFPAQLERALVARGYRVSVNNAGVSGDTSAGGLARLDWLLAGRPQLVLVELGANDALRGLDPRLTSTNLDRILSRVADAGATPILAGMRAPRNLGNDYAAAFDALYPRLAERHRVPFYPFFLDGVALQPELNQADGMHPNARGVAVIVERIVPLLEPLLETAVERRLRQGQPKAQAR